ncbi:hypothetical protein BGW80DRAFT_187970 [Lactifluus volemus]|nr:hypothetical protein BGW80DRAFT_187970 [Lactifluus volemus]
MCIECDVEGDVARYTLRSTGEQELGWMAIGFGEMMGGSPMVIMWPSRDEDGSYSSVTLSQRKAPFEVMPEPDPDPPFTATLYMEGTSVTEEHPQMAFTRPAPPDGLQEIIMAFSRTSPGSADENVPISVHHWSGQDVLNLTRIPTTADADIPPPPLSAPDAAENGDEGQVDAKIDESEKGASGKSGGGGGFASFLHAALCIAGFLFVIPSGALVARYTKATGSSTAFDLHQTLQFHVAGALIAGVVGYRSVAIIRPAVCGGIPGPTYSSAGSRAHTVRVAHGARRDNCRARLLCCLAWLCRSRRQSSLLRYSVDRNSVIVYCRCRGDTPSFSVGAGGRSWRVFGTGYALSNRRRRGWRSASDYEIGAVKHYL